MITDDIIETLSGPLKLPEVDPRAMENPITALFDLSEQISEKSFHIRRNVWYSLLFVVLWMGLTLIIVLDNIVNRNPVAVIIFIMILASGFFTLRVIFFNYRFFDYFTMRYHAIRLVREGNPNLYVPKGDTPVERFLNHLTSNFPPFSQLLNSHPESLQFSAILRGLSGGAYQFDAYIGIPGGSPILKSTNLPKAMVKQGYALFIKIFDIPPTMGQITGLEQTIKDITAQTCLPPRVIALTDGGKVELPEDVYKHLTEKGSIASCKKGNYPFNVQVVKGVEDAYDFVPLISSEGLP